MRVIWTKIILLLIKVKFHCEGGLGKMFGYKVCGKSRPWHEVAQVDGGDKCRFDGDEGCLMEVFGKLEVCFSQRRMPLSWCGGERVDYCWVGEIGSNGIFHRPLVWSRKLVMMTWFCLNFFASNLVKTATQLSSQICPMEMREPMVRSLKMWSYFALWEILVDIFNVARRFCLMTVPFATRIVGPDVMCTMWEQCGRGSGWR